MALVERQATSLGGILGVVREIRRLWNPTLDQDEEIWFRGHARRDYHLLPGLYRENIAKFNYDEYSLLSTFVNLGSHYAAPRPSTEWEWYFVAQHYRLPTRLLDWTESLLVAPYFAVVDHMASRTKRIADLEISSPRAGTVFDSSSPVIWMLDAGTLNLWSCGDDGTHCVTDQRFDGYLWSQAHETVFPTGVLDNQKPIAILPARSSSRIVAQQGMFTVHGKERWALEDICTKMDPTGAVKLAAIALDATSISGVWDELRIAGVNRLAVFPELDSLAEHLKWVYQSESK